VPTFVPLFDGLPIFGIDVQMHPEFTAREQQVNAFNGVNGVEITDFGSRSWTTQGAGRLIGATLADLVAAEQLQQAYWNPYSYQFRSTDGTIWDSVKLVSIRRVPKIGIDFNTGAHWRRYTLTLMHCI
jgi:hypothetical protein